MANSRYRRLYESFVFGQRICSISMEAEAFFWRLYVIADDYGNFEIDPLTLSRKAGGLRELTQVAIQDWVKEMEHAGLIRIYEAGKKAYGHFISFADMQVPSGPAQNPDFGMQRYCPESPWDKNPVYSIPSSSSNGAQLLKNQEKEKKESDIKKDKEREHISLGLKTNTKQIQKQNKEIIANASDLFADPEFFVEGEDIAEPQLRYFIQEAFSYWQKKCNHPRAHLSPERRYVLKKRFKDSNLEEIKRAIDGCASSDYHMGRQLNQPVLYNELTLICRDRTKLEQFMSKVTHNPRKDDKAERKRKSDEARRKWHGQE